MSTQIHMAADESENVARLIEAKQRLQKATDARANGEGDPIAIMAEYFSALGASTEELLRNAVRDASVGRVDLLAHVLDRLPDALTLGELRGVLDLFKLGVSHNSSPVDNDHRLVSGDADPSVREARDGAEFPVSRRHGNPQDGGAA